MLEHIRRFNVESGSTEDLVAMYAFGSLVQQHFEALDIEAPEWLNGKLKSIKRLIIQKNADEIDRRMKEARTRLDSLKTPIERKAELQREIARLEKMRDAT